MDVKRCIMDGEKVDENPRYMMARPAGRFSDPKEGWEVYDTEDETVHTRGMDRHDLIGFLVSEMNDAQKRVDGFDTVLTAVLSVSRELDLMIRSKNAPKEVLVKMRDELRSKLLAFCEAEKMDIPDDIKK